MLLSSDAEKAFDRVSCACMGATLQALGLGNKMMQWILALYLHPMTQVKVNVQYLKPLNITNGPRQECPLSPFVRTHHRALSVEYH